MCILSLVYYHYHYQFLISLIESILLYCSNNILLGSKLLSLIFYEKFLNQKNNIIFMKFKNIFK